MYNFLVFQSLNWRYISTIHKGSKVRTWHADYYKKEKGRFKTEFVSGQVKNSFCREEAKINFFASSQLV